MKKYLLWFLAVLNIAASHGAAQDAASSPKPLASFIGTITAIDAAAHTITVKEDKTGTEDVVQLANTRTLIKVAPGARDLKTATRITANDLVVGDRVDVRGTKVEESPGAIAARALILMSARDLQSARQAQAAEWRQSTAGVVNSVDSSTGKLTISSRRPEGPKSLTIETSNATQFTRYSPDTPAIPVRSSLSDIHVGDQVRVLGEKSADGSSIAATRLYSGAFRTVNGTIVSISPDGKQIIIKNLSDNQPVQIALNDASAVRKLPPMLAMALARRLNPGQPPADGGAAGPSREGEGAPGSGQRPASSAGMNGAPAGGQGVGPRTRGNGEISQMIERLPAEPVSELKTGDAVVGAGVATGTDNRQLLATNVIAGVEPILQAAPARQRGGESLGGDWGLGEISVPQ
jgi:Cu/Ag efflux protein CusF